MIQYVVEVMVFQALFLAVYELFFRKETFFNANRFYLLFTPILSLILPFASFDIFGTLMPQNFLVQLPAVVLNDSSNLTATGVLATSSMSVWLLIWSLGALVMFTLFGVKLYQLLKVRNGGEITHYGVAKLIVVPDNQTAFSFFKWIFIGAYISEEKKEQILQHEIVHCKEKHSVDLLCFEILKIIFWFNPLVYIFQNRLRTTHEYIADSRATQQFMENSYYQNLLSEVFQTQNMSFTNTFFNQSLIKKRLVMLHKSKSKSIFKLKYLLILPIFAGILMYTSCESDNASLNKDVTVAQQIAELEATLNEKGNLNAADKQLLNQLKNYQKVGSTFSKDAGAEVIEVVRTETTADVPFTVIENVPTFAECSGDNEEKKKCTSDKINSLVMSNFNKQLGKDLRLEGVQRIYVAFKIDKNGNVVNVRARAPHPDLAAEAERVVGNLPKMIPGKQRGENVGALYSLPIIFNVVE